jgi:hypothetical protein
MNQHRSARRRLSASELRALPSAAAAGGALISRSALPDSPSANAGAAYEPFEDSIYPVAIMAQSRQFSQVVSPSVCNIPSSHHFFIVQLNLSPVCYNLLGNWHCHFLKILA